MSESRENAVELMSFVISIYSPSVEHYVRERERDFESIVDRFYLPISYSRSLDRHKMTNLDNYPERCCCPPPIPSSYCCKLHVSSLTFYPVETLLFLDTHE